ncbi:cathepsin L-like peptidase [Epargyreus clarus]|uniref:cathepsin L-like peptidase n=1 Tax=Epargyreus clarus TaxID=520877 RepID=UPI003C2C1954
MTYVATLLLMVATVSTTSLIELVREEWIAFKMEHQKAYSDETENQFRMKIYLENKQMIAMHNQRYERGLTTFRLKQNKYTDMLHQEFVAIMNGFNRTTKSGKVSLARTASERGARFVPPANVLLPTHVDWREHGIVTDVKEQGKCGSCWAFSATGSLEGQHFRKTGRLVSLSEQNLMDCSWSYGNDGCAGGLMDKAYRYIKHNGGIDTEEAYPYEAKDGKCRYNLKNSGAEVVGFVDVTAGNEQELLAAVATVGPVSVAIDASHLSFQLYSDGVYYEENCSSDVLNHGVLVVGYGTDKKGGDYWLVKNSWGRTWGDNGYVKMARNRGNNCGIATIASYPLV